MILHPQAKKSLVLGTALLAVAVLVGAFGAHGLKNMVEPEKLVTFETGVRYHFYHGLGLVILGLVQQLLPTTDFKVSTWSFLVGTILFSFNCYFYVLTGMKVFAMIVPVGGLLFVLGWLVMMIKILKLR